MGDDRGPLDRVKDAVAAALGRRPADRHPDDRGDDRDDVARSADPRTRTVGMIAPVDPPPTPEQADRTDG